MIFYNLPIPIDMAPRNVKSKIAILVVLDSFEEWSEISEYEPINRHIYPPGQY